MTPLRIYVAGPYSAPSLEEIEANITAAVRIAVRVWQRGHEAFCPHQHSCRIDYTAKFTSAITYDRWLAFDLGILEAWATALFVIAESPGVLHEIAAAKAKPIPIYRTLDEVPEVRA